MEGMKAHWRNSDHKSGTGNTQDESGVSCSTEGSAYKNKPMEYVKETPLLTLSD